MRTDWRRLAVSIAAFAGLLAVAMLLYPGGDRFQSNSDGYRFWHTFLCDLLEAETPSGSPNGLGATLTGMAMAALTLGGMLPLWWTPPGPPPGRRGAWVGRSMGVVCCACTLL